MWAGERRAGACRVPTPQHTQLDYCAAGERSIHAAPENQRTREPPRCDGSGRPSTRLSCRRLIRSSGTSAGYDPRRLTASSPKCVIIMATCKWPDWSPRAPKTGRGGAQPTQPGTRTTCRRSNPPDSADPEPPSRCRWVLTKSGRTCLRLVKETRPPEERIDGDRGRGASGE